MAIVEKTVYIKQVPYTYDDVKDTLKSWIITESVDGNPVRSYFPFKNHDAVVQIKAAGFSEFFCGRKMSSFIRTALKEYQEEHPELYPGTVEHATEYPSYYTDEEREAILNPPQPEEPEEII